MSFERSLCRACFMSWFTVHTLDMPTQPNNVQKLVFKLFAMANLSRIPFGPTKQNDNEGKRSEKKENAI